MKQCWCNKQIIGLLIGVFLPVITSYLIYLNRYHGVKSYGEFVAALFQLYSVGKFVSISVLPNLLLFFVAIWRNRLLAARGIVIATALYAIGIFVLFLIK